MKSVKSQMNPVKMKCKELHKSAGILDDFAVRKSVQSREGYFTKLNVGTSGSLYQVGATLNYFNETGNLVFRKATGAYTISFQNALGIGSLTLNDTNVMPQIPILLQGSAKVIKYEWASISAVAASGAKPATIGLNSSGWVVATFADNLEKQVQLNLMIPTDCDRSEDIHICIGWSSPSQSLDCYWRTTYLLTAVDDDTNTAGTGQSEIAESSATVDGMVQTEFDGINVGANDLCIHIVLERDGDDILDTLGDIAEVHGIALKYTSNKLGEAV